MSRRVDVMSSADRDVEATTGAGPSVVVAPAAAPALSGEMLRSAPDIEVDGHKVTITAAKEIELRCGKALIRLTEDGKVIIRGTNVASRASGQNRIRGGSVHIN